MPSVAWLSLGLVAFVFMPGAEVLAALFAWLALLLGVGIWITAGIDAAAGMLAMVPCALLLRFVRLRVAARLW